MKRFAMVLLVGVALGGGLLFASGQTEEVPWIEAEAQEVTLQGQFRVIGGLPAVESRDGLYSLGAPQARWVADAVEEGTPVEVTGYLIEDPLGPRAAWNFTEEEKAELVGHVRIITATVDGETYEVSGPMAAGYGGGPGRRGGPHGGYHGRHHGGYSPMGGRPGPGGYGSFDRVWHQAPGGVPQGRSGGAPQDRWNDGSGWDGDWQRGGGYRRVE